MPTKVPALSTAALAESLIALPQWELKDSKLFREYKFKNFSEAFAFMTQVALLAEKQEHHPEWFNVYNLVRIELITHDAGPAVSQKDIEFAKAISELKLAQ